MKSKKGLKIGIIIGIILILIIIAVILFLNRKKETENNQIAEENETVQENANIILEESEEPQSEEEKEKIEEIKNETGLTADTNIYEVQEEYDGREVLVVKDSVQYRVALAGILNKAMPEQSKIDEILQNRPTKTGIWVTEQSRDAFLQYLQSTTKNQYSFSQDGYLQVSQESSEKTSQDEALEKYINGNKQYVIDVSGTFYLVDNVTGEITEYPFERMDKYQVYEYAESNGNIAISLTKNEAKALTSNEIIESMLALFE